MEKQAQTHIIYFPKLRSLLQWTDTVTTGSTGNYKPAAKRSVATYFILTLALALNQTFTHNSFNHTFSLHHTLISALDSYLYNEVIAFGAQIPTDRDRDLALDIAYFFESLKIFRPTNFFSSLINQLKDLGVKYPQYMENQQAFANEIRQIWCSTLNPDLIKFSQLSNKEEIGALENYLYACELMVRCKEAAVRVSPQVWEGIEDRMLRVVD